MIHARQPLGTVAYISQGSVPEPFCFSFAQLIQCCGEYVAPNGYYIHPDHSTEATQIAARNQLVQKMQGGWLMQIDSDHTFDPDLVLRMLTLFENHKLDVLCGLYHYKQPPHNPVIYQYHEGKYNAILGWGQREEVKLLPIGAAGAGCLLVRRTVFDRIKAEQGAMPFSPFAPFTTDDFSFFERCRVLDIPVHCAPQIECLHLGTTAYGAADYDSNMFEAAHTIQSDVII